MPSPNLASCFYWFTDCPSFQIRFPVPPSGSCTWWPTFSNSCFIMKLFGNASQTSFYCCHCLDYVTSGLLFFLNIQVFWEAGTHVVLLMCKETRCEFFINNCCLASEFCPTSREESEAQGGWVIPKFSQLSDIKMDYNPVLLTLIPVFFPTHPFGLH